MITFKRVKYAYTDTSDEVKKMERGVRAGVHNNDAVMAVSPKPFDRNVAATARRRKEGSWLEREIKSPASFDTRLPLLNGRGALFEPRGTESMIDSRDSPSIVAARRLPSAIVRTS